VGADFTCERCGQHVGAGKIDLQPGPGLPRTGRAERAERARSRNRS
jgi:hypothetical protein